MEVHLVIHRQQELYGGQHNPRVYLKFEKGATSMLFLD